jgi:hypothetical protein
MRAALVLLLALPLTSIAQSSAFQRRGNLVSFNSPAGAVEVEWLSPSTFRLQRCAQPNCPTRSGVRDPIEFTVAERPGALEFRSRFLQLRVDRLTATITVRNRHGKDLFAELNPGRELFQGVSADGERYYGLGARSTPKLDLRGQTIETGRPLLISSAGFGLYFFVPSQYTFDLAQSAADRIKVRAPFANRLEYFFYYGPSIKEVLEEHLGVTGAITPVHPGQLEILPASQLPKHATSIPPLPFQELLPYLAHASLSGVLTPAMELTRLNHPAAAFLPLLTHANAPKEAIAARNRWLPYLYTYLDEASTRGLPLLRPLVMQYPDDPAAREETSAFMIGDELLIPTAPRIQLPMGLWTDLCTNTRYRGRQAIEVANPGSCPLTHNGTIVPIDAGGHLELHYFPRLAAEFFLCEHNDTQVTQVHAGPAGEYLRLEIESRVGRTYEWVVHHVSDVAKLECTGCTTEPSNVRYDRDRGNYHVRVNAAADSDIILNITLREPL